MTTRFWTTAEVKILREHYEKPNGPELCADLLPHRALKSIYQQARRHGLKAAGIQLNRKRYTTDEFIDAAIIKAYQGTPDAGAITALSKRIMRPRRWIYDRALKLGVVQPRIKESAWTKEELELLEQHAHKAPQVIARIFRTKGYKRTPTAIMVKRKRLQLDTRDYDHYTAREVGRLMGVDGKTVTRWIELYGLPAKRRGTRRTEGQHGDEWRISVHALRSWIAHNAAHVDLRKVDRFWFIDLLTNRDLGSIKEAA